MVRQKIYASNTGQKRSQNQEKFNTESKIIWKEIFELVKELSGKSESKLNIKNFDEREVEGFSNFSSIIWEN